MRTNGENFRPSQIPTLDSDAKFGDQAERTSLDVHTLVDDRITYIPETLEKRVSFKKLEGKLCIFERRSLSRAEICRHVQSILASSEQSCRKPTQ